jgi:hypothetical protein
MVPTRSPPPSPLHLAQCLLESRTTLRERRLLPTWARTLPSRGLLLPQATGLHTLLSPVRERADAEAWRWGEEHGGPPKGPYGAPRRKTPGAKVMPSRLPSTPLPPHEVFPAGSSLPERRYDLLGDPRFSPPPVPVPGGRRRRSVPRDQTILCSTVGLTASRCREPCQSCPAKWEDTRLPSSATLLWQDSGSQGDAISPPVNASPSTRGFPRRE